jgi:uncharacterized protein
MRVGLISDTHGLIRPEALRALAGVELILHAGDVGGVAIITALEAIAPVRAVLGNTDAAESGLQERAVLTLGTLRVHVSHGHELGSPAPERLLAQYDADVIVYGHTHRPLVQRSGGRLVVNPGAAGPRRFHVRPSVAILEISDGSASAEIVFLDDRSRY